MADTHDHVADVYHMMATHNCLMASPVWNILSYSEAYLRPSQSAVTEVFAKMVNI